MCVLCPVLCFLLSALYSLFLFSVSTLLSTCALYLSVFDFLCLFCLLLSRCSSLSTLFALPCLSVCLVCLFVSLRRTLKRQNQHIRKRSAIRVLILVSAGNGGWQTWLGWTVGTAPCTSQICSPCRVLRALRLMCCHAARQNKPKQRPGRQWCSS